jgi:hypothetical protein
MKRSTSAVSVIALAVLVAACTHTVTFKLKPDFGAGVSKQTALSQVQPGIKFALGKVADKRADISKLSTFKQGAHTFNVFGARPIEEVVAEGLGKLFTFSGHEWVDASAAEVRVDLQILSVSTGRNAGFVTVGASSGIQIKLDFVDMKTSQTLFSEIYNGKDERERAMVGTMSMVEESMNAAIVNCINAVGKDSDFAKALKKLRA